MSRLRRYRIRALRDKSIAFVAMCAIEGTKGLLGGLLELLPKFRELLLQVGNFFLKPFDFILQSSDAFCVG